jgi:hypothetical protein
MENQKMPELASQNQEAGKMENYTQELEKVPELAKALAKAQSELRPVKKDSNNSYFDNSYSSLSAVWDACRDPLTRHGLCVVQMPKIVGGMLLLETRLLHESGQSLSGFWPIKPEKAGPQAYGSALTYARRYTLSAMVGVSSHDDDGNAATIIIKDEAQALAAIAECDAKGVAPNVAMDRLVHEIAAQLKASNITAKSVKEAFIAKRKELHERILPRGAQNADAQGAGALGADGLLDRRTKQKKEALQA